MRSPQAEWEIDENECPRDGTDAAKLAFVLRYAVLAPSGHNTQPWLFRIHGFSVDVIADRTRGLAVVDPEDRELAISCGAATETLVVALDHFGLGSEVTVQPDSGDPDVVARVTLTGTNASDSDDRLFSAITRRRTVRQAFEDEPLPNELLTAMSVEAQAFNVRLDPFTDPGQRRELAALVAEGDRMQFADRHFRRELAAWIHSRRARSRDGISGAAFGMPDVLSPLGSAVVRTFDIGGKAAERDEEIAAGSPSLIVFSTDTDSPEAWIATGRALTRVLLHATAENVRASYLNQPVELPALRSRLAGLPGVWAFPQLLMRFGYGPMPEPAVRRPVEDVLLDGR